MRELEYGEVVFTGDGVTKTFATTEEFGRGSTYVFVSSVFKTRDVDYTEGADYKSIVFEDAPDSGYEIVIRYTVATGPNGVALEPTNFKDQLSDDAINCLLNTDEFAEEITYTPLGIAAKTINALVVRERLQPDPQSQGRILAGQIEIYIANNSTYGMASIVKGYDKVSLPERINGANVDWKIVDVMGHDDGMWHLLVQK